MKRLMTMIVAIALVAGIGTTVALARGGHGAMGRYYVDGDNDGVCDYYCTGCGRNHVDADGDGVCDYYGTGSGRYYVDADGDGVCDHYGTGWGRNCRRA